MRARLNPRAGHGFRAIPHLHALDDVDAELLEGLVAEAATIG